ncbi:hypothetical protein Sfum_2266 [Syntrophobacter fumaroxidans MPOB]|uniref:Uncharacterized protein n=1 Tax=Syntrophobacter fumaroxidans (strain DSM 10017 / MPOB) TaxID=335543 RepID=A0LKJ6_SYNFM|nr:hypothetical protein Sfum_2266 [Syntrophobacter fumaroxidans MPOB]
MSGLSHVSRESFQAKGQELKSRGPSVPGICAVGSRRGGARRCRLSRMHGGRKRQRTNVMNEEFNKNYYEWREKVQFILFSGLWKNISLSPARAGARRLFPDSRLERERL